MNLNFWPKMYYSGGGGGGGGSGGGGGGAGAGGAAGGTGGTGGVVDGEGFAVPEVSEFFAGLPRPPQHLGSHRTESFLVGGSGGGGAGRGGRRRGVRSEE